MYLSLLSFLIMIEHYVVETPRPAPDKPDHKAINIIIDTKALGLCTAIRSDDFIIIWLLISTDKS